MNVLFRINLFGCLANAVCVIPDVIYENYHLATLNLLVAMACMLFAIWELKSNAKS